ncbi:MAG: branched-chain amino acid ABC transporter permease [Candidatus Tectomicrobia bacterium]|nr:branched-chain amino acid ABC transporter permease [Candidatus Tectomicrobia bacterium]
MKSLLCATFVVVGVWLVLAPWVSSAYLTTLQLIIFMYICLASSWNLISGYVGYVSFGHVVFFGVGAYVGGIAMAHGTAWPLAVLFAGLGAALLAVVIGYPCLRLRGAYFAIAMLAVNELVRILVLAFEGITKGATGLYLRPIENNRIMYYAMAVVAAAVVLTARSLNRSKFGLRLMAIREDEVAAEVMGIDTTRLKVYAFILSAFFPGLAGALFARYQSFIDPESSFAVLTTIQMIIMTLFGGKGTVLGPVLGAVVLSIFAELVWVRFPFLHQSIFGLLIVTIVLLMPNGVLGLLRQRGIIPLRKIL